MAKGSKGKTLPKSRVLQGKKMSAEIIFNVFGNSNISGMKNLIDLTLYILEANKIVYFSTYIKNQLDPSDPTLAFSDFSDESKTILFSILDKKFDFIDVCVNTNITKSIDNYFLKLMTSKNKGCFVIDKLIVSFGKHFVQIRDDEDEVIGFEECNLSFSFSGQGSPPNTGAFREACRKATDIPELTSLFSALQFPFKTQAVCSF